MRRGDLIADENNEEIIAVLSRYFDELLERHVGPRRDGIEDVRLLLIGLAAQAIDPQGLQRFKFVHIGDAGANLRLELAELGRIDAGIQDVDLHPDVIRLQIKTEQRRKDPRLKLWFAGR